MTGAHLALPYVKKVSKISDFTVWRVDGAYIRKNIEPEFTNFGQHFRFRCIPEDEFWLDQEHNKNETHYFIDHLLLENRLMAEGITYKEAITRADRLEKRERSKAKIMRKIKEYTDKEKNAEQYHKRMLPEYSQGKLKVWSVNGDLVRSALFIDFTEGGHDKVYKFVPENEVWLDDDLEEKELKFVLIHEVHERFLMSQGKKYPPAHKDSTKIEYYCRNHPKETDRVLREEIARNI